MPVPGLGHKSYVQFGKETTYGTAVPATIRLEIVSWNVPQVISTIQDTSLFSAQSRRANYQGGSLWKGSFTVRMNYEGLEELFRAVHNNYVANPVDGITLRDHVFKEQATLPSYTFEVVAGDIPTGKCFLYTGVKISDVTVRGSAGTGNDAMLMCDFTIIAKDCVSNQTPTAGLTANAPFPVMFNNAVVTDDGTTDTADNIRLRSFTLTLAQPHTEDRFYLGSLNIDEPVRSDFLTATMQFSQEFVNRTQYDAARSFTSGSPRLVFRNPGANVTVSPGAVSNVSGSGVFIITRTGGDYATGGVKVGYQVNSAVFPAGTTVTAVSTTQITVDRASTGAATNASITFTGHVEFEISMGTATVSDFSTPVEGYGVLLSSVTWDATYDNSTSTAVQFKMRNTKSALV